MAEEGSGVMERYRILPHTADGKFQAFGRTLDEAFGNAALALASLMWDWTAIAPKVRHPVRVTGVDKEQLLVKFLGEVVYLFETRQFLLGAVAELRILPRSDGLGLEAVLVGETLSPGHELFGGVKAVTYHELKIEECGGFTVQVVVDK
jgi:SHS2 domain-containing protein